MIPLLLMLLSPAASADCGDPRFRARAVAQFVTRDRVKNSVVIRDIAREERAKEGSPALGGSDALRAYLDESYEAGADVHKAMDILKHFDYEHFIRTLRRYAEIETNDEQLKAQLNGGMIMFVPGQLAELYMRRLDELLAKLGPDDQRRKAEIFERVDRRTCSLANGR